MRRRSSSPSRSTLIILALFGAGAGYALYQSYLRAKGLTISSGTTPYTSPIPSNPTVPLGPDDVA